MSSFVIRRVASGVKFDLLAENGQVIASSEVYDTKAACEKGIASVRKLAPVAKLEDQTVAAHSALTNPKFEIYLDKAGQYRFRLKARNGKIIAVSESYRAKPSCEHGVDSVRRNAPIADCEEE